MFDEDDDPDDGAGEMERSDNMPPRSGSCMDSYASTGIQCFSFCDSRSFPLKAPPTSLRETLIFEKESIESFFLKMSEWI